MAAAGGQMQAIRNFRSRAIGGSKAKPAREWQCDKVEAVERSETDEVVRASLDDGPQTVYTL